MIWQRWFDADQIIKSRLKMRGSAFRKAVTRCPSTVEAKMARFMATVAKSCPAILDSAGLTKIEMSKPFGLLEQRGSRTLLRFWSPGEKSVECCPTQLQPSLILEIQWYYWWNPAPAEMHTNPVNTEAKDLSTIGAGLYPSTVNRITNCWKQRAYT